MHHRSKPSYLSQSILSLGIFALAAIPIKAEIVAPYSPDAATLHLWHLDESDLPVLNSIEGGNTLNGLGNGATLGNPSLTGFGTALSTFDGGPTATATTGKDAYLSGLPLVNGPADNIAILCQTRLPERLLWKQWCGLISIRH